MKVWATTVREEKITRDIVFEYEHISNEDDFVALLQQICEKLDIPTPVVTYVNFNHYVLFNTTKFKSRDFVESIDFDYFNLEAVPDKKKK
ncbi:MAG: hypothetical protein IJV78_01910 [Clostridia bacterium]|nr:hypothetical protein [Clostridia bacterium]MBQ9706626.1 hypothetical protein [Clostridia bacterium]MBR7176962.1 hypothetical protein [Clostridia bacterium]